MSEFIVVGATLAVTSSLLAQKAKPTIAKKFRKLYATRSIQDFEEFQQKFVQSSTKEGETSVYMQENFNELLSIIKSNANTEFGQEYHFNNIQSYEDFKNNVPIQFYSNMSDKIDRMCESGKNLFSPDKTLLYFATSSGTTGKSKMIPVSSSYFSKIRLLFNASAGQAFQYCQKYNDNFDISNLPPLAMPAYSPPTFPLTKSGIPYGPLSQSSSALPWYFSFIQNAIFNLIGVTPKSLTNRVLHFETNLLLQVFIHLMTEELMAINITFGATLMHYLVLLETHYLELLACIESGSLSPCEVFCQNIPKNLQDEINDYIYRTFSQSRRSKRVEYLRTITSFDNVVDKIWPSILYVSSSVSGGFSVYEEGIRRYIGNLPLIGAIYMCSEGSLGFQYNENGEYMFHPSVSFFEFIHEDDIKSENPKTLILNQLEIGNRYELVITTQTGFYRYRMGDVIEVVDKANNNIPLFKICYRTGSILDAFGEKTTEVHVEEALKRYANEKSLKLVDFTTFLPIERSPVVYQIFVEFQNEDGSPVEEIKEDASSVVDKHLRDVHKFYDKCREQTKLGEVEVNFVASSTFIELKEQLIEAGTAPLQCKIPRLIKQRFLPFIESKKL